MQRILESGVDENRGEDADVVSVGEVRLLFDSRRLDGGTWTYPQTKEPRARNRQNECRRQEALERLEMRPIGIACGACSGRTWR